MEWGSEYNLTSSKQDPQMHKAPGNVIDLLVNFDWVNGYSVPGRKSCLKIKRETAKKEGMFSILMQPTNNALQHPAGPLLLKYAENGCPVEVGRSWTPEKITAAVKRRILQYTMYL